MPTKSFAELDALTLTNPKSAAAYLSAVYELCAADGKFDALLLAIRELIQAHHKMGKIAKSAGVGRQALYHMLSGDGNPQLDNFAAILKAVGLKMKFEPVRKAA